MFSLPFESSMQVRALVEQGCQIASGQGLQARAQNHSPPRKFLISTEDHPHSRILERWYESLTIYSSRRLTFEWDRFPVIAGVAKIVHERTGFTYKAGLWEEDMLRGLSWRLSRYHSQMPLESHETSITVWGAIGVPSETYLASSWSWASFAHAELELDINIYTDMREVEDAEIIMSSITSKNGDIFQQISSGFLKIKARCCLVDDILPKILNWDDDSNYRWLSCLHCTLQSSPRDFEGRGLLLLHIVILRCSWSSPEYCALILEPTKGPVNEYRRIGIIMLEDDEYQRTADKWTIQVLNIV
jgi:hypothetical protein